MISTKITRQGVPQGDSKVAFGKGKFAQTKDALSALDDVIDYSIDQLKRKRSNKAMMDVARCLVAEIMQITHILKNEDETILYIATSHALYKKKFLPEFDKILYKWGFRTMTHENFVLVAYADNVRKYSKRSRRNLLWLRQSFMRLGFGAFDRYLNPWDHEWESQYGNFENCKL